MSDWLASLNYARNVGAHHARLFNRKLQNSPGRPKPDVIPVLNHLREFELKGGYGAYNILAVVAYLLTCIEEARPGLPAWSRYSTRFRGLTFLTFRR